MTITTTKFARRCPRCGNDDWYLHSTYRNCAKCGWTESWMESPTLYAEPIKKALAEGKDEKLISIPPQAHFAYRPPPNETVEVSGPDIGEYLRKHMDKIYAECDAASGIPLATIEQIHTECREGVFCGTTGDKEHVKEKATFQGGEETLARQEEMVICKRCHRTAAVGFRLGWACTDQEWVCSTCQDIILLDAPPAWREKATLPASASRS